MRPAQLPSSPMKMSTSNPGGRSAKQKGTQRSSVTMTSPLGRSKSSSESTSATSGGNKCNVKKTSTSKSSSDTPLFTVRTKSQASSSFSRSPYPAGLSLLPPSGMPEKTTVVSYLSPNDLTEDGRLCNADSKAREKKDKMKKVSILNEKQLSHPFAESPSFELTSFAQRKSQKDGSSIQLLENTENNGRKGCAVAAGSSSTNHYNINNSMKTFKTLSCESPPTESTQLVATGNSRMVEDNDKSDAVMDSLSGIEHSPAPLVTSPKEDTTPLLPAMPSFPCSLENGANNAPSTPSVLSLAKTAPHSTATSPVVPKGMMRRRSVRRGNGGGGKVEKPVARKPTPPANLEVKQRGLSLTAVATNTTAQKLGRLQASKKSEKKFPSTVSSFRQSKSASSVPSPFHTSSALLRSSSSLPLEAGVEMVAKNAGENGERRGYSTSTSTTRSSTTAATESFPDRLETHKGSSSRVECLSSTCTARPLLRPVFLSCPLPAPPDGDAGNRLTNSSLPIGKLASDEDGERRLGREWLLEERDGHSFYPSTLFLPNAASTLGKERGYRTLDFSPFDRGQQPREGMKSMFRGTSSPTTPQRRSPSMGCTFSPPFTPLSPYLGASNLLSKQNSAPSPTTSLTTSCTRSGTSSGPGDRGLHPLRIGALVVVQYYSMRDQQWQWGLASVLGLPYGGVLPVEFWKSGPRRRGEKSEETRRVKEIEVLHDDSPVGNSDSILTEESRFSLPPSLPFSLDEEEEGKFLERSFMPQKALKGLKRRDVNDRGKAKKKETNAEGVPHRTGQEMEKMKNGNNERDGDPHVRETELLKLLAALWSLRRKEMPEEQVVTSDDHNDENNNAPDIGGPPAFHQNEEENLLSVEWKEENDKNGRNEIFLYPQHDLLHSEMLKSWRSLSNGSSSFSFSSQATKPSSIEGKGFHLDFCSTPELSSVALLQETRQQEVQRNKDERQDSFLLHLFFSHIVSIAPSFSFHGDTKQNVSDFFMYDHFFNKKNHPYAQKKKIINHSRLHPSFTLLSSFDSPLFDHLHDHRHERIEYGLIKEKQLELFYHFHVLHEREKEKAWLETELVRDREMAERNFKEAREGLDSARDDVRQIDPKHLFEIQSYRNPPEIVQFVMSLVLIVLGADGNFRTHEGGDSSSRSSSANSTMTSSSTTSGGGRQGGGKNRKRGSVQQEQQPPFVSGITRGISTNASVVCDSEGSSCSNLYACNISSCSLMADNPGNMITPSANNNNNNNTGVPPPASGGGSNGGILPWSSITAVIRKPNFLSTITNDEFPPLTESKRSVLTSMLARRGDVLSYDAASYASVPVGYMYNWVRRHIDFTKAEKELRRLQYTSSLYFIRKQKDADEAIQIEKKEIEALIRSLEKLGEELTTPSSAVSVPRFAPNPSGSFCTPTSLLSDEPKREEKIKPGGSSAPLSVIFPSRHWYRLAPKASEKKNSTNSKEKEDESMGVYSEEEFMNWPSILSTFVKPIRMNSFPRPASTSTSTSFSSLLHGKKYQMEGRSHISNRSAEQSEGQVRSGSGVWGSLVGVVHLSDVLCVLPDRVAATAGVVAPKEVPSGVSSFFSTRAEERSVEKTKENDRKIEKKEEEDVFYEALDFSVDDLNWISSALHEYHPLLLSSPGGGGGEGGMHEQCWSASSFVSYPTSLASTPVTPKEAAISSFSALNSTLNSTLDSPKDSATCLLPDVVSCVSSSADVKNSCMNMTDHSHPQSHNNNKNSRSRSHNSPRQGKYCSAESMPCEGSLREKIATTEEKEEDEVVIEIPVVAPNEGTKAIDCMSSDLQIPIPSILIEEAMFPASAHSTNSNHSNTSTITSEALPSLQQITPFQLLDLQEALERERLSTRMTEWMMNTMCCSIKMMSREWREEVQKRSLPVWVTCSTCSALHEANKSIGGLAVAHDSHIKINGNEDARPLPLPVQNGINDEGEFHPIAVERTGASCHLPSHVLDEVEDQERKKTNPALSNDKPVSSSAFPHHLYPPPSFARLGAKTEEEEEVGENEEGHPTESSSGIMMLTVTTTDTTLTNTSTVERNGDAARRDWSGEDKHENIIPHSHQISVSHLQISEGMEDREHRKRASRSDETRLLSSLCRSHGSDREEEEAQRRLQRQSKYSVVEMKDREALMNLETEMRSVFEQQLHFFYELRVLVSSSPPFALITGPSASPANVAVVSTCSTLINPSSPLTSPSTSLPTPFPGPNMEKSEEDGAEMNMFTHVRDVEQLGVECRTFYDEIRRGEEEAFELLHWTFRKATHALDSHEDPFRGHYQQEVEGQNEKAREAVVRHTEEEKNKLWLSYWEEREALCSRRFHFMRAEKERDLWWRQWRGFVTASPSDGPHPRGKLNRGMKDEQKKGSRGEEEEAGGGEVEWREGEEEKLIEDFMTAGCLSRTSAEELFFAFHRILSLQDEIRKRSVIAFIISVSEEGTERPRHWPSVAGETIPFSSSSARSQESVAVVRSGGGGGGGGRDNGGEKEVQIASTSTLVFPPFPTCRSGGSVGVGGKEANEMEVEGSSPVLKNPFSSCVDCSSAPHNFLSSSAPSYNFTYACRHCGRSAGVPHVRKAGKSSTPTPPPSPFLSPSPRNRVEEMEHTPFGPHASVGDAKQDNSHNNNNSNTNTSRIAAAESMPAQEGGEKVVMAGKGCEPVDMPPRGGERQRGEGPLPSPPFSPAPPIASSVLPHLEKVVQKCLQFEKNCLEERWSILQAAVMYEEGNFPEHFFFLHKTREARNETDKEEAKEKKKVEEEAETCYTHLQWCHNSNSNHQYGSGSNSRTTLYNPQNNKCLSANANRISPHPPPLAASTEVQQGLTAVDYVNIEKRKEKPTNITTHKDRGTLPKQHGGKGEEDSGSGSSVLLSSLPPFTMAQGEDKGTTIVEESSSLSSCSSTLSISSCDLPRLSSSSSLLSSTTGQRNWVIAKLMAQKNIVESQVTRIEIALNHYRHCVKKVQHSNNSGGGEGNGKNGDDDGDEMQVEEKKERAETNKTACSRVEEKKRDQERETKWKEEDEVAPSLPLRVPQANEHLQRCCILLTMGDDTLQRIRTVLQMNEALVEWVEKVEPTKERGLAAVLLREGEEEERRETKARRGRGGTTCQEYQRFSEDEPTRDRVRNRRVPRGGSASTSSRSEDHAGVSVGSGQIHKNEEEKELEKGKWRSGKSNINSYEEEPEQEEEEDSNDKKNKERMIMEVSSSSSSSSLSLSPQPSVLSVSGSSARDASPVLFPPLPILSPPPPSSCRCCAEIMEMIICMKRLTRLCDAALRVMWRTTTTTEGAGEGGRGEGEGGGGEKGGGLRAGTVGENEGGSEYPSSVWSFLQSQSVEELHEGDAREGEQKIQSTPSPSHLPNHQHHHHHYYLHPHRHKVGEDGGGAGLALCSIHRQHPFRFRFHEMMRCVEDEHYYRTEEKVRQERDLFLDPTFLTDKDSSHVKNCPPPPPPLPSSEFLLEHLPPSPPSYHARPSSSSYLRWGWEHDARSVQYTLYRLLCEEYPGGGELPLLPPSSSSSSSFHSSCISSFSYAQFHHPSATDVKPRREGTKKVKRRKKKVENMIKKEEVEAKAVELISPYGRRTSASCSSSSTFTTYTERSNNKKKTSEEAEREGMSKKKIKVRSRSSSFSCSRCVWSSSFSSSSLSGRTNSNNICNSSSSYHHHHHHLAIPMARAGSPRTARKKRGKMVQEEVETAMQGGIQQLQEENFLLQQILYGDDPFTRFGEGEQEEVWGSAMKVANTEGERRNHRKKQNRQRNEGVTPTTRREGSVVHDDALSRHHHPYYDRNEMNANLMTENKERSADAITGSWEARQSSFSSDKRQKEAEERSPSPTGDQNKLADALREEKQHEQAQKTPGEERWPVTGNIRKEEEEGKREGSRENTKRIGREKKQLKEDLSPYSTYFTPSPSPPPSPPGVSPQEPENGTQTASMFPQHLLPLSSLPSPPPSSLPLHPLTRPLSEIIPLKRCSPSQQATAASATATISAITALRYSIRVHQVALDVCADHFMLIKSNRIYTSRSRSSSCYSAGVSTNGGRSSRSRRRSIGARWSLGHRHPALSLPSHRRSNASSGRSGRQLGWALHEEEGESSLSHSFSAAQEQTQQNDAHVQEEEDDIMRGTTNSLKEKELHSSSSTTSSSSSFSCCMASCSSLPTFRRKIKHSKKRDYANDTGNEEEEEEEEEDESTAPRTEDLMSWSSGCSSTENPEHEKEMELESLTKSVQHVLEWSASIIPSHSSPPLQGGEKEMAAYRREVEKDHATFIEALTLLIGHLEATLQRLHQEEWTVAQSVKALTRHTANASKRAHDAVWNAITLIQEERMVRSSAVRATSPSPSTCTTWAAAETAGVQSSSAKNAAPAPPVALVVVGGGGGGMIQESDKGGSAAQVCGRKWKGEEALSLPTSSLDTPRSPSSSSSPAYPPPPPPPTSFPYPWAALGASEHRLQMQWATTAKETIEQFGKYVREVEHLWNQLQCTFYCSQPMEMKKEWNALVSYHHTKKELSQGRESEQDCQREGVLGGAEGGTAPRNSTTTAVDTLVPVRRKSNPERIVLLQLIFSLAEERQKMCFEEWK